MADPAASTSTQDTSSTTPTNGRRQATASDAVLLALKQIDPVNDLKTLPSKPCARQALLLGIGGGMAVGAIRFLSSRRPLASSNWAVATFALLSLTSWETCRRQHLIEQNRMKAAMAEYRSKASGKGSEKVKHAPVGGVLMGQKGQQILQEKQEENRRLV